jgi:fucose permease
MPVTGIQPAELWERQMPDPRRIRVLMGSFALLGVWLGALGALLQLWATYLRLGTPATGNVFLVLGLGSLIVPLAVLRATPSGRTVQRLFVASGILGAVSFLWLSRVVEAFWILPPLLVLGFALGALNAATALLLRATLTLPRAGHIIELAGIFFSVGAMTACLLLWVLSERLGAILWLLALVFVLLAWRVSRTRFFEFLAFRPDSVGLWGQIDRTPRGILLALALFLEAGTYWTIGGWLAFYLGRKFGTAGSTSLAILGGFWLALTLGRVASQRLPPLEKRLRWLVAASGLCFVGSIFLIQTAEISGAVVGALCLGSGLGLLHPLTLGAVTARHPQLQPRLLHTFFLVTFSVGLLIPWAVGHLAARMGIEIVVWTALAAGILIFILLGIVVIESKLDQRAAPTAS